jgi:CheY-like chemotaxis protein
MCLDDARPRSIRRTLRGHPERVEARYGAIERGCSLAAHDYMGEAIRSDVQAKELATMCRVNSSETKPEGDVAPSDTAAAQGGRKRRVLILDDSEMVMRLLEADLTSKGFEVFTADTADKATKIILKKQTRPDLVLLDVRMPGVNGEQFCRFIKGNSLFKGIKVLLCSGENVEELQRICREAGADGFVTKDAVLSKVVAKELD